MRSHALGSVVLAAALPLAACTAARSGPAVQVTTAGATPVGSAHSAADVAFLERLAGHDQQGLTLVALAPRRAADARIGALADRIAGTLRLEIQGLRAQLLQWEVAKPGTYPDPPGHADDATVEKLTAAHGAAFDPLWLRTMIAHDRGAIALAQAELTGGASADAVAIARTVSTGRQAQIDELTALTGPA